MGGSTYKPYSIGYYGSLTSFASWELSLFQLLIGSKGGDGGQWQQWLWGFIVGFELAYASHLIGEHAALFIHTWLLRGGAKDPHTEVNKLERPSEAQEEKEELYGADELNKVVDGRHTASRDNGHGLYPQDAALRCGIFPGHMQQAMTCTTLLTHTKSWSASHMAVKQHKTS